MKTKPRMTDAQMIDILADCLDDQCSPKMTHAVKQVMEELILRNAEPRAFKVGALVGLPGDPTIMHTEETPVGGFVRGSWLDKAGHKQSAKFAVAALESRDL